MKKVAYRIKKLRESKDFKPGHVAGELGISYSAYSKIERGVTDPTIGRLEQIAKILNVSITYFFADEKEQLLVEENKASYGYATKTDIEKINTALKELGLELQTLKKKLEATPVPQKRKSRK